MLHAQVFVRDANYRRRTCTAMCALRTGLSLYRLAAQPLTLAENPFPGLFQKRLPDLPDQRQQQAGLLQRLTSPQ